MSKKKGLRAVLVSGSALLPEVRDGMQALSNPDRTRISASPSNYVVNSLALDERRGSTGEWDYLLGIDDQKSPVIGVEVHPATNGEVKAVIAKKQRTHVSLQPHMPIQHVRRWIWIASGKDTVARGSTEYRQLIQAQIQLVGRHLRLR